MTNICEYNEAVLTEAMAVQFHRVQRKRNLVFYVLCGIMLAASLGGWLTGGDPRYGLYGLITLGFLGMLLYFNWALPKRVARAQVPRIREQNGGLTFCTQFREEGLTLVGPTGEEASAVPYGSILGLTETEHLLLLFNREKHMIILDRSRFSGGTEADFRQFLSEKCPLALPKKSPV